VLRESGLHASRNDDSRDDAVTRYHLVDLTANVTGSGPFALGTSNVVFTELDPRLGHGHTVRRTTIHTPCTHSTVIVSIVVNVRIGLQIRVNYSYSAHVFNQSLQSQCVHARNKIQCLNRRGGVSAKRTAFL